MAVIKAAIEQRAEVLFRAGRRTGDHQRRETYLIDALEQQCRAPGGQDRAGTAPGRRATGRPAAPAYLGLIRVDHAALVRGKAAGDELCEIAGLGPIPIPVARGLLGDAVLHLTVTKGSAVASTVNLRRGPNVAQRMALLWRSPLCEIDGCAVPRVEIDHDTPWARTRHTRRDGL